MGKINYFSSTGQSFPPLVSARHRYLQIDGQWRANHEHHKAGVKVSQGTACDGSATIEVERMY